MKQIMKFIALTIVMIMFAVNSYGQASANATASATAIILTPISITTVDNLSFGTIVPSSTLAGSVLLSPAGVTTLTNVTLHPSGTVTPATFDVTGEPGLTYTIAIAPATVNISNGGTTMSVSAFTSTPAVGVGSGLLDGTTGTQTISVGALLTVGANQAPGTYTNATAFTVTINYN
jgi:hypothetical protein